MAYRFLLEVPESLAEAANIAVEQVGDSQVLVVRPSHGLGIDDPYIDLTVASHSLQVIDTLFTWFESIPAPRPDVRIVLHGGDRHSLAASDRARMVAMIRRDQPWVERSIPLVGEHEPTSESVGYSFGPGAPPARAAATSAAAVAERPVRASAAPLAAPGPLQIQSLNYVLIQVNDLQKGEAFYREFFAMELLGRLRRGPEGTLVPLPQDYTWEQAMRTGELADVTFLANGPLTLAVQRVGMGVVLGKGPLDLVSIGVDSHTFATVKGEVLMRPFTMLRSGVASFVFRDPMNVNWEIAVAGSVPLIPT